MANGRKYRANFHSYFEFLNRFRADISSIDYNVQEYIVDSAGATVVIPLDATILRLDGSKNLYHAIMLLKFNKDGKII